MEILSRSAAGPADDEGDGMKAERLSRKTYLKKHSVKPDGDITVYDLTASPLPQGETVLLDEIEIPDTTDFDKISALPHSFETQDDILSWCAALIAESPAASALYQDAAAQGWQVGLSDLHSSGFHLDIPGHKILLDHFAMSPAALGRSAYFRNTLLITFIRALRDIWHEHRNVPFEDEYGPEDVLMLERVRAADCDTVTVFAVWELRGAGYAEIWRHLIGSAEGDMAMIFSRFLERDPSALFDGGAMTYAFRQWYADEARVDGCDHETLEALDDILLDTTEIRAFGSKRLEALAIERLACMPDGTCYLAGLGDTIRRDPFFAGLHDEINQTHLFHLMYDMEVTMVNNVPFRDRSLARKMFPQGDMQSS
ncbi:MAG: hypothetical protein H6867_02215 [Rhodospirillales bacterium]|nr:hypothetical protein [Rhodospirillales bacterium]MCB9997002.1 hypothetical protein [Rhodospirillales bacterium]